MTASPMLTGVVPAALLLVLSGCAAQRNAGAQALSPPIPPADAGRLRALFAARADAALGDYCVGRGDILTVNVFAWDAMRDLTVRVSPTGTITLPMLGDVPAWGRTTGAIQKDIEARLRNGYMRDPHVTVFVRRFRSQQVAVTGAVARPGLYSLSRESRTLYDVLSQAGGLDEEAGGRIRFTPAAGSGCDGGADGDVAKAGGPDHAAPLMPIEFDVGAASESGRDNPLLLTVVGGDSIVVTRGRFMVDGWVAKPGPYTFTPGMTAYGAMSTAGGVLFPADVRHAQIVRARPDGTKEVVEVDLAAVGSGEAQDVALREGDVVRFGVSPMKMVPYSVYWVFTNLFRIGAGISVAGI
jgi:polysaccharide export outer membrane protein